MRPGIVGIQRADRAAERAGLRRRVDHRAVRPRTLRGASRYVLSAWAWRVLRIHTGRQKTLARRAFQPVHAGLGFWYTGCFTGGARKVEVLRRKSGRVAERLMATGCKPVAPCGLRRFESSPVHQNRSNGPL